MPDSKGRPRRDRSFWRIFSYGLLYLARAGKSRGGTMRACTANAFSILLCAERATQTAPKTALNRCVVLPGFSMQTSETFLKSLPDTTFFHSSDCHLVGFGCHLLTILITYKTMVDRYTQARKIPKAVTCDTQLTTLWKLKLVASLIFCGALPRTLDQVPLVSTTE